MQWPSSAAWSDRPMRKAGKAPQHVGPCGLGEVTGARVSDRRQKLSAPSKGSRTSPVDRWVLCSAILASKLIKTPLQFAVLVLKPLFQDQINPLVKFPRMVEAQLFQLAVGHCWSPQNF